MHVLSELITLIQALYHKQLAFHALKAYIAMEED